jgi:hypothetical protein
MKLVRPPLARTNEQEETVMRKLKLALALVASFVSMGCGLEVEGEAIEDGEDLGSVSQALSATWYNTLLAPATPVKTSATASEATTVCRAAAGSAHALTSGWLDGSKCRYSTQIADGTRRPIRC